MAYVPPSHISESHRSNSSELLRWGLLVCLHICSAMISITAGAQLPPLPVEPVVEWDKRQDVGERLAVYGMDLLGDSIDQHTGDISFRHTDISLPGNSGLQVALSRKLTSGHFYRGSVDVEFGDWTYDVPRLHVVTAVRLHIK